MIKTDSQLARTEESIAQFKAAMEAAESIEDPTERKLTIDSHLGMINCLELEVARYTNAKAGYIELPASITSISNLCPYVADLRIALGWTQEDLANQLGVTRQAVNKWEEHEYRDVDVAKLVQILDVIGLRIQIEVAHELVNFVRPAGAHHMIMGSTFSQHASDDVTLTTGFPVRGRAIRGPRAIPVGT